MCDENRRAAGILLISVCGENGKRGERRWGEENTTVTPQRDCPEGGRRVDFLRIKMDPITWQLFDNKVFQVN